MPASNVYCFSGDTTALSVANTVHATVQFAGQATYASFLNPGSKSIFVITWPITPGVAGAPTAPTFVFPLDGTPSGIPQGVNSFILPPLMEVPMLVDVPAGGFNVSAIAESSGPTIFYVTRVRTQS